MSSTKLLTVIGITGAQGGSVAKTFIPDPAWRVRGISRSVDTPQAQALSRQGVEMVQADLGDLSALKTAFDGSSVVFSTTDFFSAYGQLSSKQTDGFLPKEVYHLEMQWALNTFAAAAETTGLERFIYSSLSDTTKWSQGKYKYVFHFDAKAHAVEQSKKKYPELWQRTSIIQLGWYLKNLLEFPLMPRKGQGDIYNFVSNLNGQVKVPVVAPEEDTGPFVKALVSCPPGKNLISYREWLTVDEVLAILSRVTRRQVQRTTLPRGKSIEGLPVDLVQEFTEMFLYWNEYGFEGRDDPTVIHPNQLEEPIRVPTVEEWMKKQDWDNVLEGQKSK